MNVQLCGFNPLENGRRVDGLGSATFTTRSVSSKHKIGKNLNYIIAHCIMNTLLTVLFLSPSSALPLTEIKEEIRDILITVKTTQKYHQTRLKLLLETWSKEALQNVSSTVCPSQRSTENFITN